LLEKLLKKGKSAKMGTKTPKNGAFGTQNFSLSALLIAN
jgi:hypothetical protein